MTKTFKTQMSAALIALTFCAVAAPASAQDHLDNLPARAASAVSAVIANQGNAALLWIRQDLKDNLLERLAPYLPHPEVATDAKSSDAEDRKS